MACSMSDLLWVGGGWSLWPDHRARCWLGSWPSEWIETEKALISGTWAQELRVHLRHSGWPWGGPWCVSGHSFKLRRQAEGWGEEENTEVGPLYRNHHHPGRPSGRSADISVIQATDYTLSSGSRASDASKRNRTAFCFRGKQICLGMKRWAIDVEKWLGHPPQASLWGSTVIGSGGNY